MKMTWGTDKNPAAGTCSYKTRNYKGLAGLVFSDSFVLHVIFEYNMVVVYRLDSRMSPLHFLAPAKVVGVCHNGADGLALVS